MLIIVSQIFSNGNYAHVPSLFAHILVCILLRSIKVVNCPANWILADIKKNYVHGPGLARFLEMKG